MVGLYNFAFWVKDFALHLSYYWFGSSGFLRAKGVPYSLYIDDCFNWELLTCSGPWSQLLANRSREYLLQTAGAALFVVLSVLVELG